MPKLSTPFRPGRAPDEWAKAMRACGWAMALGGLAAAACALVISDLRTALLAGGALVLAFAMTPVAVWAVYGLVGRRVSLAPPKGK